jgi:hypothetical protein
LKSVVNSTFMKLTEIPLQFDDNQALPSEVATLLSDADALLQRFWDDWYNQPIEQYVACDFPYVWHALKATIAIQDSNQRSFIEWGCGFGVVTAMAWLAGLPAVGIEAEPFLVDEANKLFKRHSIKAEIWHGNFLPKGAETIADCQSDYASLFHRVPPAYLRHDCELSDFGIVFAYPWPGEDHFLREVFRRYASENALLLMFRGPYQIELFRKVRGR